MSLSKDPCLTAYNGVEWDVNSITEISGTPVPTACGRAVKWVKYKVKVQGTVGMASQAEGKTTDDTLADMRLRLQQFGGELHCEDLGFGPLIVNVPPNGPTVGTLSRLREAAWGPKPSILSWRSMGRHAAEVTWECELHIHDCPDAVRDRGIVEWITSVTYAQTPSGYTTRTIDGHITVAQTRVTVDATGLTDHADRLREQVTPPPLNGFRREFGPWKLSPDKCTLNFSIVDREYGPGYPPPGVTTVNFSHEAGSAQAFAGGQFTGTFRGSYRVARGVSPAVTARYFRALCDDRLDQARRTPFRPKNRPPQPNNVFIRFYSASEPEVYRNTGEETAAAFSLTYQFLATRESLILASGLWRQIPAPAGGDWTRWAASLADSAFNVRGNSKLRFDPSVEAIVELCHDGRNLVGSGGPALPQRREERLDAGVPRNTIPPPGTSYLLYTSSIRIEVLDDPIVLKPLPSVTRPPSSPGLGPTIAPFGKPGGTGLDQWGIEAKRSGGATLDWERPEAKPVIQRPTDPTYVVYLEGQATRVGYQIEPPALVSVGGANAIPAGVPGTGYRTNHVGSFFGVNVWGASWRFRYVLDGRPNGAIPVLPTPYMEG